QLHMDGHHRVVSASPPSRPVTCTATPSSYTTLFRSDRHDAALDGALAGVYCELREQACKQIFVRELQALRRLTHVGYYDAMLARPRVLTKACWARDCCEST